MHWLTLRFDDAQQQEVSSSRRGPPYYFAASLLGFAAGCVACDLAPGIDSSGLPALLFIVPSMLTAVLGLAAVRGPLAPPVSSSWPT